MFDTIHSSPRTVLSWVRDRRYRLSFRFAQCRRAWRYATDRLSSDDAQRLMLDCWYPAGWHPLLVLTVEDTLEQAREAAEWASSIEDEELRELVARAARASLARAAAERPDDRTF